MFLKFLKLTFLCFFFLDFFDLIDDLLSFDSDLLSIHVKFGLNFLEFLRLDYLCLIGGISP